MTSCPTCGEQLPDSRATCQCGDEHVLLSNGAGQVVARISASSSITPALSLMNQAEPLYELPFEIVAEPIVGYRIWTVDDSLEFTYTFTLDDLRRMERDFDEGRNPFKGLSAPWLSAVGVNEMWPRTGIEAKCKDLGGYKVFHNEPSPDPWCSCGIWAMKDEQGMLQAFARYQNEKCAWGQVQLWGRIVETRLGYRAQYARPLSISVYGISEEAAVELADAYECEVSLAEEPPVIIPEDHQTQWLTQAARAFAVPINLGKFRRPWYMRLLDFLASAWFLLAAASLNFAFWITNGSLINLVMACAIVLLAAVMRVFDRR